ncbi:MAG: transcription elongation factor GreA [Candidatus Paralactobacillus gallistercoris]|uniref:Transcription elongation factor GreA n=1 Tax=Candidatus Paralactobacillus gallistercoris TaxID=2838724 RepID=A0A948TKA9_9LACO|nr:transcription elongation factor GreA [Candidatus Paralactobacillus gallistercoris]
MVYYQKMTQAGYDQINQQIDALKKTRPALIKALQAARALGDLSENAEYSAAKHDLRHLESRLRYLGKQLRYAEIVHAQDDGIADIGKTVTIIFLDDHEQVTYQLVGHPEVNLEQHKLANDAPLARAIIGHHAGEIVTVNAPNGTYQVKIITVALTK